ncbi:response regulator [Halosimplex amylolyticum]|uniref:response regulator n=1 Tax=Halosimplex amylolyticum TaxID=3396616 RepID=UPI003F54602F
MSPKVLCVDDHPDAIAVTEEFLARELPSADVRGVTTATEALEVLAEDRIDCVVSDYEMPDVDGLELLRTIRADRPDLPFILFTARGSEEIASEAISEGVTDYLQKRGTEQYALLANRIENAVSQYRAERDLADVRRKLERLHATALELRDDDDRDSAYRCAVETARDVLQFDTCGFYELRDGAFVPTALVDFPDQSSHLRRDEGLIGKTYETGESYRVGDVRAVDEAEPIDDSFRSALSVPVGDHGVFQAISTTVDEFEERDLELAELLVSHLVGALDRIEYERDLERTNEQLETVLENTTAHIYIKDRDGRYTLVNESFADRLGYDREAILGRTDEELQNAEIAREVRENDRRAIAAGRTVEIEESAEWDGERRVYYSVKAPLFDDDGTPKGVCGVSSDITELKARERELERKTERLEEFASLVSHDLRNPLMVAQARLDLLEGGDEETVAHIDDALSRMESIVEGLLTLSRSGQTIGETEPVDLETVATDAWRTVETGDAELVVEADRTVEVDCERVTRLFENLFRNAVEHGSTSPRSQAPEDAVEHGSTSAPSQAPEDATERGESVTVTVEETADGFAVEDDGPGLPDDVDESVFSPGVSTDPRGTGFGLAIVSRVAAAHDWDLRTPADTDGARFEFRL